MNHLNQYFKRHFVERSFEQKRAKKPPHIWALLLVLAGLSSLGWISNNMPIEAERTRYDGQNLLMPADTDTVKIVMPPLDFGQDYDNYISHDCGGYHYAYPPKGVWILDPYIPEPMNLEKVLAQVAYPQELKVCEHISLKILIDRDGQYIRHKAIKGDSVVIAALEPYFLQLKFLPNPLGFDVSPRWVELEFRLPLLAQTTLPAVDEFVYCDSEPQIINFKEALTKHPFPSILKDAGIDGGTMIRVLVSEEGDYLDHQVLSSVHPILAKHWSQVVKELVFSPAQYQGKNIAFWVDVPFYYHLFN